MNQDVQAVLLDLDGTLLDTAGDLVGIVNRLLLQHRRSPAPLQALRPYVSQGAICLISHAFKIDEGSDLALSLKEEFLALYRDNLSIHANLFDGMEGFLAYLEQEKILWGIVTNKPEWLTIPLIEEIELDQRTACIVGGDTLKESKPSPAPILHACNLLGVHPSAALMVGDDKRDIDSGNAAGTTTAAAGWGYIQPDDCMSSWQADHSFDSVKQLHEWFD